MSYIVWFFVVVLGHRANLLFCYLMSEAKAPIPDFDTLYFHFNSFQNIS